MSDEGSPRVLVVDDDEPIRLMLRAVCKRLQYACDVAREGAEALEKIDLQMYDVILLDLMMPRVSGQEVIEAIRVRDPRPSVIVVTAQGPRQTAPLENDEIVSAVIRKPFELQALQATLIDVIRKRRD